jgi:hypothetical protein
MKIALPKKRLQKVPNDVVFQIQYGSGVGSMNGKFDELDVKLEGVRT